MQDVHEDVPAWPAWLALAAPAAAWAGALPGVIAGALIVTLLGGTGEDPGAALLGSVLTTATAAVAVWLLLRRFGSVTPAALGLRIPSPKLLLAGLGAGVIATVIIAAAVTLLFDPFATPSIPAGLSEVPFTQQGADDITRVTLGPGLVAILAAVTIAGILGEIVARGIVLPALASKMGAFGAILTIAGVSTVLALLSGLAGGPALGLLALGLLNGWLYVETGSVLPSVAVSSGSVAALVCAGLQWLPAECALTGIVCGGLALLLVAGPALAGRSRRGPGSGWAPRPTRG